MESVEHERKKNQGELAELVVFKILTFAVAWVVRDVEKVKESRVASAHVGICCIPCAGTSSTVGPIASYIYIKSGVYLLNFLQKPDHGLEKCDVIIVNYDRRQMNSRGWTSLWVASGLPGSHHS